MAVSVQYSRKFLKNLKKRILPSPALSVKFDTRVSLFTANPANPILRDHVLSGSKVGLQAFSITGDIRVVYKTEAEGIVTFLDIGTHNQVYK
jgi:addiction module RelE/StbE family toxin